MDLTLLWLNPNCRQISDIESKYQYRQTKTLHSVSESEPTKVLITFDNKAPKDDMKVGTLCIIYWSASLMWFVDAIFEYAELKAEFFTPAIDDMVNDAYLGFSVVALGLIVWLVILLIKYPKGKVKAAIFKKQ
jgi:hypothetical protein